MSAILVPTIARRGLAARAAGLFWRSAAPSTRWILFGIVAALCMAKQALNDIPALFLCALALWWLWIPRLALVQRDAWQARLPDAAKERALVMLLAAIPVLVFVVSHTLDPHKGITLLSLAALALAIGVIGSFLSPLQLIVLNYVPIIATLCSIALSRYGVLPKDALRIGVLAVFSDPLRIALFAATVCGIAAIQWRRFVRQNTPKRSWFRTPLLLLSNDRATGGFQDMKRSGLWISNDPLTRWLTRHTRRFGPDRPEQAMRTLLGQPFAPLTLQQIAVQAVVVPLLPFMLASHDTSIASRPWAAASHTGEISLGLGVFILLYLMHAYRLRQFMQQQAGERAELALLPGWGDAKATRRVLVRAMLLVWRNATLALGVVLVVGVAWAWRIADIPPQQWAVYALLFVELYGYIVAMCMLWLAGCRFKVWIESALWLGGILLPAVTMVWFALAEHQTWPALIAAHAGVLSIWSISMWRLLQRFRARPHPFLQV